MLDLSLAVAHHLLAFAVLGILAAELVLLHTPLGAGALNALTRIDLGYGLAALLLILAGFSRAVFAAKGWLYYSQNLYFWMKLAVFGLIGLISIRPTLHFAAWRKRARTAPGHFPNAAEIAPIRKLLWIEIALFALLPLLAASMARGLGVLGA